MVVFQHRIDEIECFGDLDVRMLAAQQGEFGTHAVRNVHLTCATAARDFESDYRFAVEQRGRALLGHRVADVGHAIEPHAAPVGERDLHARKLVGRAHGSDGAHRLLDAADIGAATRSILLDLPQLARNVGRGGIERQHARRVEFDAHLATGTADAGHRADALHAQHAPRDSVVDEPGERLVVHARRGNRVGEDRRAGQIHARDHRVAQVAWQIGAHPRNRIAHIVHRLLGRFLQAELDGHRDQAVLHLGINMLDALQGGDRVLELARDVGFHLRWRGTRQGRADRDGGQVNVGELLDLHRPEGHRPQQGEHDEQQDRRNRIADRPGGDVQDHVPCQPPSVCAATRTTSPSARNPPPLTTTCAFASSPPVISMRSPERLPTETLVCATRLSPSSRNT